MIHRLAVPAAAAGLLICSSAAAQEPPYPTVSTGIDASLFYILQESDADDTQHAFLSAQPSVTIEWWENVFLTGILDITDYQPAGEDSFFQHQDVSIDDIDLLWTNWIATAQFGKTSLPFGLAPDNAPGLFGSNFVGDYGYDGLITALAGYDLGHPLAGGTKGTHTIFAGSFFVDTTFMSASAFGEQSRVDLDDGGPANTENFESYFITYDATGVPFLPGGVDYRASYVHNAAGVGDTGDEEGFSIGTVVPLPLAGRDALSSASGDYIALAILAEYAHFDNFDGTAGVDHDYWTLGVEGWKGQWFATATTTLRQVDDPLLGDDDDKLFALSGGYQINEPALIQAGYAFEEIANVDSHYFGLELNYAFQPNDFTSLWPTFGQSAHVLTNTQLSPNYRR